MSYAIFKKALFLNTSRFVAYVNSIL